MYSSLVFLLFANKVAPLKQCSLQLLVVAAQMLVYIQQRNCSCSTYLSSCLRNKSFFAKVSLDRVSFLILIISAVRGRYQRILGLSIANQIAGIRTLLYYSLKFLLLIQVLCQKVLSAYSLGKKIQMLRDSMPITVPKQQQGILQISVSRQVTTPLLLQCRARMLKQTLLVKLRMLLVLGNQLIPY